MAWIYLLLAGIFEIVWAVGLKYSGSFTKFVPSLITIAAMIASIVLLSLSMRTIALGTAYTIWTGIGAVGSVIAGIMLFNESADLMRLLCIGIIICGVIGLKLSSS